MKCGDDGRCSKSKLYRTTTKTENKKKSRHRFLKLDVGTGVMGE